MQKRFLPYIKLPKSPIIEIPFTINASLVAINVFAAETVFALTARGFVEPATGTVADLELGDGGADGEDGADAFVAEGEGVVSFEAFVVCVADT